MKYGFKDGAQDDAIKLASAPDNVHALAADVPASSSVTPSASSTAASSNTAQASGQSGNSKDGNSQQVKLDNNGNLVAVSGAVSSGSSSSSAAPVGQPSASTSASNAKGHKACKPRAVRRLSSH